MHTVNYVWMHARGICRCICRKQAGLALLLFCDRHLLGSTLQVRIGDGTDLVALCELAPALWISLFEQHFIVCDGENLQITAHTLNQIEDKIKQHTTRATARQAWHDVLLAVSDCFALCTISHTSYKHFFALALQKQAHARHAMLSPVCCRRS